jgi:hypothetical protein
MTWVTRDEVGFIRRLGTAGSLQQKLELLEKYKASIPNRAIWTTNDLNISRKEVETVVAQEIFAVQCLMREKENK